MRFKPWKWDSSTWVGISFFSCHGLCEFKALLKINGKYDEWKATFVNVQPKLCDDCVYTHTVNYMLIDARVRQSGPHHPHRTRITSTKCVYVLLRDSASSPKYVISFSIQCLFKSLANIYDWPEWKVPSWAENFDSALIHLWMRDPWRRKEDKWNLMQTDKWVAEGTKAQMKEEKNNHRHCVAITCNFVPPPVSISEPSK